MYVYIRSNFGSSYGTIFHSCPPCVLMAAGRAPVCVVHGNLKLYINDVSSLPTVLDALLPRADSGPSADGIVQVASLSKLIVDTFAASSGTHYSGLRDAIFHHRRCLSSGVVKQLQALNTTYSFLRHFADTAGTDLVELLSRELLAPSTAKGDSGLTHDIAKAESNITNGDSDFIVNQAINMHNTAKVELDSTTGDSNPIAKRDAAQRPLASVTCSAGPANRLPDQHNIMTLDADITNHENGGDCINNTNDSSGTTDMVQQMENALREAFVASNAEFRERLHGTFDTDFKFDPFDAHGHSSNG
jgi:hypothetical protein